MLQRITPSRSVARRVARWTTALALVAAGALAAGRAAHAGESARLWTDGHATRNDDNDPLRFGTFAELAHDASPAVVSVNVDLARGAGRFGGDPNEPDVQGTGFFINAEGYAVTNHHVVESALRIEVETTEGRRFPATVVGSDEATDLALLKVEAPGPVPFTRLGDSSRVRPGDWVVAIGNPLGLSNTVTAGIVSAIGRRDVHPEGRRMYEDFIQTDASINPGNSGGPLLDIHGNVIGVNSAMARGNNVGFAIPINAVKTLLPQLKTGAVQRAWLGVKVQALTPELATSLGLDTPRGALVSEVVRGGPAEEGGVQQRDVILKFGDEPVDDADELRWLASVAGVGSDARIVVWRDGSRRELSISMGRLPGGPVGAAPPTPGGAQGATSSALGLTVVAVDPTTARNFGLPSDATGVLVVGIEPRSVARGAGLAVGDLIQRVGDSAVRRPEELESAVSGLRSGSIVQLQLRRGDASAFVAFRLP